MNLREQFEKDTRKSVNGSIMDRLIYLQYSGDYVYWLESKVKENELLHSVSNSNEIIIPKWWHEYKRANPSDKDDYNPKKHCCSRFWKDWCNCMK